jgi:serine/threonine protein kinase
LKISPALSTPPWIILYGIARGLGFLHAIGFVHGSLTSDSILLDGRSRPVIADLGFSVPIGASVYTSPEVLSGAAPTPGSDVSSFGILAYELIEGIRTVPGTLPVFSRIGSDLATFFTSLFEAKQADRPRIAEAADDLVTTVPAICEGVALAEYRAFLDFRVSASNAVAPAHWLSRIVPPVDRDFVPAIASALSSAVGDRSLADRCNLIIPGAAHASDLVT